MSAPLSSPDTTSTEPGPPTDQQAASARVQGRGIHPLARFILIRLLISAVLAIGVTLVTFILTNLVPADPVQAMLGDRAAADPEVVAQFRANAGLDKPLPVQYVTYLGNLLQGDLGVSNQTRQPITDEIARALPASIELGIGAVLISIILGLLMGLAAALNRNKFADQFIRVISLFGVSAPTFWIATIAYYVFFLKLQLVAGSGRLDAGMIPPPDVTGMYVLDSLLAGDTFTAGNALSHLILPSIVLSLTTIGLLTRFTRSAVLEVLNQDYVRAARAKGLPTSHVIWRYVFRGALVPVITVVGLAFGSLLSGAVLTETVFAWNGLGQFAYRGATQLDLPVIMGVGLVIGLIYIGVNFAVDLVYGFVDPRVRVK